MGREISRGDDGGAKPRGRRVMRPRPEGPDPVAGTDRTLCGAPIPQHELLARAAAWESAGLLARSPAKSAQPGRPSQAHMSERMEAFWRELLEVVGSNFSGSVVLHCTQGAVQKYEVHQVLRPSGGSVALENSLDGPGSDSVRSSR